MKNIYIVDEAFNGQACTNPTWTGDSPIFWNRNQEEITENTPIVIYTDDCIWRDKKGKIKIAWLFEGRTFKPGNYEYIERNHSLFDYVFTWDKTLIDLNKDLSYEKFIFIPYGGSWIDQKLEAIYPKSKNISIVASGKKFLPGHLLRHEVIEKLSNKIDGIYGYGYNPVSSLLEAYKDYRFTIVIENERRDWGFSEKLITPMLCGTIPIYCGMPSIGDVFCSLSSVEPISNGIIQFNTVDELSSIIDGLDASLYDDFAPAISKNFEIAKNYRLMELQVFKIISNIEIKHGVVYE